MTFPTTVFLAIQKDRDGKPRGFEKALNVLYLSRFDMEQRLRDSVRLSDQGSYVVTECVIMSSSEYAAILRGNHMKKYAVGANYDVAPEYRLAGRFYEVVYTQAWQDGRYLPPVAKHCTEVDAQRIVNCLNACEGTLPENVQGGFNQLIEDHAKLKVAYNNLRCDG